MVAIAISTLLVATVGAALTIVDETSADIRRGADLTTSAFDCLFAHVVESVPPDARVVIRADETFWLQRLTEIVHPFAHVVDDVDVATHEVIVVQPSESAVCADVELVVVER